MGVSRGSFYWHFADIAAYHAAILARWHEVAAEQIIANVEAASNDAFEPSKYRDTVRDRVMETIQRKVDGQDITTDVAADGGSKVLDLMEALKASLAGVHQGDATKVKVS